jgi:hypothetical protein
VFAATGLAFVGESVDAGIVIAIVARRKARRKGTVLDVD